jgi:hypothetical protein
VTVFETELQQFRHELRAAIEADLRRHRGTRRPVRRVVALGTPVAAASIAATLLVVGGGGGTDSAFAGWSANPTLGAAYQTQPAQSVCLARVEQGPPSNQAQSSPQSQGRAPTFTPVLTDTRGPFTVTVFSSAAKGYAFCLAFPDGSTSLRGFAASSPAVPANTIGVDQVTYAGHSGAGNFGLIVGRVGSGVSAVTVVLNDGTVVETSVGSGLFVAWWPGTQGIRSAEITTSTGVVRQPVNTRGALVPAGAGPKP